MENKKIIFRVKVIPGLKLPERRNSTTLEKLARGEGVPAAMGAWAVRPAIVECITDPLLI